MYRKNQWYFQEINKLSRGSRQMYDILTNLQIEYRINNLKKEKQVNSKVKLKLDKKTNKFGSNNAQKS